MLNLNGELSVEILQELQYYTDMRFKKPERYHQSAALSVYEQKLIPEDRLLEICSRDEGIELKCPPISYIPNEILEKFVGEKVIPVSYSPPTKKITCVSLKEFGDKMKPKQGYEVEVVYVPIYFYLKLYIRHWGRHDDLLSIPAKTLFDFIIKEAISAGAADITISSSKEEAVVYYNVRKKKVVSNRIMSAGNVEDIVKLLCIKSPMLLNSNRPKYVSVDLNDEYRGRVVINPKFKGTSITIRLLPNATFDSRLEDCNLTKETIDFIRDELMSSEVGLRLFVGPTMSGKNTTALSILNEVVHNKDQKVVSVEMPVEQELRGVEQMNCEDDEEFDLVVGSLLRQNPDIIYVTEIGDKNANSVMKVCNTGKWVLSTIHANGVSDVFSRLEDITRLPVNRIIQVIHSIVFQELIRDEDTDTVRPKNRYVYLSQERKQRLYNCPYEDIIKEIKSWEAGDLW